MGLMSCLPSWLALVRGLYFAEEQFRDNSCTFPLPARLRHRQLPQSCDNTDNQAPTDLHGHDGYRVQVAQVRSRHPCTRVRNSTTPETPQRHRFQALHPEKGAEACWISSEKFGALKGKAFQPQRIYDIILNFRPYSWILFGNSTNLHNKSTEMSIGARVADFQPAGHTDESVRKHDGSSQQANNEPPPESLWPHP